MRNIFYICLINVLLSGCSYKRTILMKKNTPACGVEEVGKAVDFWEEEIKLDVFDLKIVDKLPKRPAFGTMHIVFKPYEEVENIFGKKTGGSTSGHIARSVIELQTNSRQEVNINSPCRINTANICAHEFGHHFRLRHLSHGKDNLMNNDSDQNPSTTPGEFGWHLTRFQKNKAKRRAKFWIGNVF